MRTELDSTEIAAALLFEARGLVAADPWSGWPVRCGRTSALGALTTVWAVFPRRDGAGKEGFALARTALRGVGDETSLSEVAPTPVLRDVFDRALAVVRDG